MPLPRFVPAAAALLVLAAAALAGDLEDGIKLKEAGKFDQALPKLQKAVDADPANAAAAVALCQVLTGLGKYEQAAKCVGPALDAHPDDVALMVAKARAFISYGDAMARDNGDANMILAYVADGDTWVKRALDKDPKNSEARYLKARVLQHQNGSDQTEATAELEALAKDDPKCFDAHWELGQIWMRKARADNTNKNKWAAAEKHFRDAFTADPKSGQALLQATYAKAWQQIAKAPEMVADYAQCAPLLPSDEAPLSAMWKLRKYAPAEVRAAFEKLSKDPAVGGRAKAYVAVLDAQGAVEAGKPAEAVKACVAAVDAWGKDESRDVFGAVNDVAYIGKGLDKDDREKIWNAAWKNWPARFETPNNAGLWYRDVGGDAKRSSEWYVRAAEIATNSPQVLNDTGLIFHYNLHDLEKAEPWYRKALAAAEERGLAPSNDARDPEGVGYRDALNNLAKLLSAQKRWNDLRAFAEDHVPEEFPGREQWLNAGKDGK